MTKEEIQAELDKSIRQLAAAKKMNMPQVAIDKAESKIKDFTAKLAEFGKEPAKPSMPVKKSVVEKVEKKAVSKRGRKALSKEEKSDKRKEKLSTKVEKSVTIGDKTYTEKDKEFCDMLLKKWEGRKVAMKKANKKYKTKTISQIIGSDIAHSVVKVIEHINDTHEKQIEKNPTAYIKKFERIEDAANKFVNVIKSELGADYKSSQFKSEMDAIEKAIQKIKSDLKKHAK